MLNRLKNFKMKNKILKQIHSKERVKMNGVEMTLGKVFLSTKVNGASIFQAVEQGHGQRKDDVFVYFHPEHKRLVKK